MAGFRSRSVVCRGCSARASVAMRPLGRRWTGSAARRPIPGRGFVDTARPCRCVWACEAGSCDGGRVRGRAGRRGRCCGCRSRRCRSEAPGLDPEGGEERQGAAGEGDHGVGLLVAVELGVGDPRVIVDDRVAELPADLRAFLGAGAAPVPGDAVPRSWQKRAKRLVSICNRSPGQGHSKRTTASRGALGVRETPWRLRIACTVECATPVSPAINRGPHPVRSRAPNTRVSIARAVRRGERRGRLERSPAHSPEQRADSLACCQRRFHLWAVARETARLSAARRSGHFMSIIR